MSNQPIIPVILCGGSGTRLWPLSRESFPKQYLSIGKENNNSLLQRTQSRIKSLKNIKDPLLICNEDHRFIVAEQMREINVKPNCILLEPFGKNTGPAIALAALKSIQSYEDPILLVMSSDHEIENKEKFINVLNYGIDFAKQDRLLTFGVIPTSPEIGYGYIKAKKSLDPEILEGVSIDRFLEKPNLDLAEELIKDKRFTWNSGIFMFKAHKILEELKEYSPDIVKYCTQSIRESKNDLDFLRIDKNQFKKCPNISIDIAVMEKTNNGTVIPLNVGWSDIGSWKTVWEISDKDDNGNFTKGKILLHDTQNCYLRGEKRLIVAIGIKDLIVVETNDAILISEKNQTQKVKDTVQLLKKNNIPEGQTHRKMFRPWGYYLSVVEESRWQVKLIYVKPGEKLSLQMHHHRSEHWIIVNGTAKVELDNKVKVLSENQSIYIPLGSQHRLTNPGKIPLTLIEVQSGAYLGEDDIIRFDDIYGR